MYMDFQEGNENIKTNQKCGFEVDKELTFLPSYFFEPPTDASKTDTLYISVVVKGTAELVTEKKEMAAALNALMEKNQIANCNQNDGKSSKTP